MRLMCLVIYSYLFRIVGPAIKNPPAKQETQVWSLGWEDILEKEVEVHILAWEISQTEQPGGLPSMRSKGVSD